MKSLPNARGDRIRVNIVLKYLKLYAKTKELGITVPLPNIFGVVVTYLKFSDVVFSTFYYQDNLLYCY